MMAADLRLAGLAGLAALALLSGCGGGEPSAVPSSSSSVPQATRTTEASGRKMLTEADDGAVVALKVGQTVTLHVPGPEGAPGPAVTGDAVMLIPVLNVAGTATREWEIRAVRPGESLLSIPRQAGGAPAAVKLQVQ